MRTFIAFAAFMALVYSTAHSQTVTSTVVGTVVPARSWDISAEVSNKINRLHFIEGQIVSKLYTQHKVSAVEGPGDFPSVVNITV